MSKKILCRVVRTAPLERSDNVFVSKGQRHKIDFDVIKAERYGGVKTPPYTSIRWPSKESTGYTFGVDYSSGGNVDFYA
jgi:hypothetical protein